MTFLTNRMCYLSWFYFITEDSPTQIAADSAGAHIMAMILDRFIVLPLLNEQVSKSTHRYIKSLRATCSHIYGHNLRKTMPITLYKFQG